LVLASITWPARFSRRVSYRVDKVLNLRTDSKCVSGVSEICHAKKIFIIHLRSTATDIIFEALLRAMWISD